MHLWFRGRNESQRYKFENHQQINATLSIEPDQVYRENKNRKDNRNQNGGLDQAYALNIYCLTEEEEEEVTTTKTKKE